MFLLKNNINYADIIDAIFESTTNNKDYYLFNKPSPTEAIKETEKTYEIKDLFNTQSFLENLNQEYVYFNKNLSNIATALKNFNIQDFSLSNLSLSNLFFQVQDENISCNFNIDVSKFPLGFFSQCKFSFNRKTHDFSIDYYNFQAELKILAIIKGINVFNKLQEDILICRNLNYFLYNFNMFSDVFLEDVNILLQNQDVSYDLFNKVSDKILTIFLNGYKNCLYPHYNLNKKRFGICWLNHNFQQYPFVINWNIGDSFYTKWQIFRFLLLNLNFQQSFKKNLIIPELILDQMILDFFKKHNIDYIKKLNIFFYIFNFKLIKIKATIEIMNIIISIIYDISENKWGFAIGINVLSPATEESFNKNLLSAKQFLNQYA